MRISGVVHGDPHGVNLHGDSAGPPHVDFHADVGNQIPPVLIDASSSAMVTSDHIDGPELPHGDVHVDMVARAHWDLSFQHIFGLPAHVDLGAVHHLDSPGIPHADCHADSPHVLHADESGAMQGPGVPHFDIY
jgi:hypothetical protein